MERRGGGVILAFDAGCGPCSRFKDVVEFLDARRLIGFLDIQEADMSGLLDGVPQALRFASFHILDGQVTAAGTRVVASGSGAILPLLRVLSPSASRLVGRVHVIEAALRFGYSTLSRLHTACPASRGRATPRGR